MTLVYDDSELYEAALAFLTHMMILGLLPGVTALHTKTPLVGQRQWTIEVS
jgi:hypothetical protein